MCSPGYIPISSFDTPSLMGPHTDENDTCYAAYTAAYYAAQAAYYAAINANLDPADSNCVAAGPGGKAINAFNVAAAQAQVDYWNCRSLNG